MKLLSVIGLISVLFLGILFVYVAEDIPAFGDPNSAPNRYVKLFNIDAAGSVEALDQGVAPEALVSALEARGFRDYELPSSVEKVAEGEWDAYIIPPEKYYQDLPELRDRRSKYFFIKEEGATLEVYRYAPIIRYIEEGEHETEVPNMVTYILADYRAYDTLGETAVIFTAGISVILLLRRRGKKPE